jgi:PIN domain nuclease of toxin-antitoxin system
LPWWFTDSPRLPNGVRSIISDQDAELYVSAATGREVATKSSIGKLPHVPTVVHDLPVLMARNGFRELPITMRHSLLAGSLTSPHRDSFGRMIAAQAIAESLEVLTVDTAIAGLGAKTMWT